MAKRIWTSFAAAVAQKWRVRLSGEASETADLIATIGRNSVTAESGGEATDDVLGTLLQDLVSRWNASAIPEFGEVTATFGTDLAGDPYVDLEADDAGKPFDVTFSAPYPTIDVDTLQQGGPGVNEIQRFWVDPVPTGGGYVVRWNLGSGLESSAVIPAASDATAIKAALLAGMASLTEDNISVTGTASEADPCIVELLDDLGETDVAELSVDVSALTGNGAVTINTLQEGGAPTGGGSNIFTDTFTDTNGTLIDAHSADTAQGWTADANQKPTIQSNKLAVDFSVNGINDPRINASISADFSASVDVNAVDGKTDVIGIEFRRSDASNLWRATINTVTGKLQLMKRVANVDTYVATGSVDHALGTTYTLAVRTNGNSIVVETDLDQISYSSSFNATVQTHGLYAAGETATGATGWWDNFVIDAVAVGDEIWSIYTNGTGGTFTLTKPGGSTTSALAPDSTTAQIKSAIESIYGGTFTVTGSGTLADPWLATAGGALAGANQSQPTGNGTSLTGGFTAVVEVTQDGSAALAEQYQVIIYDATGGVFQLTFRNQTTADIAFGASAATVQAALEALSIVGAGGATVTGAGTAGSPYLISLAAAFAGTDYAQLIALNEDLTGPVSITVTVEELQASRGPHHADDPANWLNPATGLSGLPVDGDDVFIEMGDADSSLLYGLDLSDVDVNSLTIFNRFGPGEIGLPQVNSDGGYYEYRDLDLLIGFDPAGDKLLRVGVGQGGGSGRIQIDTGADEVHIEALFTGGSVDGELPAFLWKGTHASNTALVIDADFGAGVRAGETFVLASLIQRGGIVTLGPGSVGAIDKTGGELLGDEVTINGAVSIRG